MARIFLLIPLLIFVLFGCAPPPKAMDTKFYPELPNEPRMQFLTSITDESDLGRRTGGLTAFVAGQENVARIGQVYDIAPSTGKLYFSDSSADVVGIIDFPEKAIAALSIGGAGRLLQPRGITVADDHLYVADMGRRQVVVFNALFNNYVRTYGSRETLEQPLDVAVYFNRVYVSDFRAHNIKVFDRYSGELIQTIGGRGEEEGLFDRPTYLKVDLLGNLYVNDSHNFRIQKFDLEGKYLHHVGYPGDTPGGFARPKGHDISRDGFLYVADAAFENVQVFHDLTQFLVYFFGGFGNAPSFMYLPQAVTIDYVNVDAFKQHVDKDFKVEYLLYVTNMLGDYKINVYGFGKWIGPPLQ